MTKGLLMRLERVEARLAPLGEPLVIEVELISPAGLVVGRRSFTCNGQQSGRRRGSRPWQRSEQGKK
jgi:hypothetical protein